MKSLPLTGKNGKGKFALVSDDKYEMCRKRPWKLRGQYPCTLLNGKFVYLHRFVKEPIPEDVVVDHINGCTLCAWDENLRVVTQTENLKNKHKNVNCGHDHTRRIE